MLRGEGNSPLCTPKGISLSLLHSPRLPCDSPPQATSLLSGARDYLDPFLQCSVLFFQSFTGIEFILPSDGELEHVFSIRGQSIVLYTNSH